MKSEPVVAPWVTITGAAKVVVVPITVNVIVWAVAEVEPTATLPKLAGWRSICLTA